GAAIRGQKPAACRWSKSADRGLRAHAGWQGGAWSTGRRWAKRPRAVHWSCLALPSAAGDDERQRSPKFLKSKLKTLLGRELKRDNRSGGLKAHRAARWQAGAARDKVA